MTKIITLIAAISWMGLWLTPDQHGQQLFEHGQFIQAAETFQDPLWQGIAWYRAGEFKKSAEAFALRDTADANYNQGNALLMHGKYQDAITSYDRALEKRTDWQEALENRLIAVSRAKMLDIDGGNMTEGMLGADEIVFDDKVGTSSETMEIAGSEALSNQEIQALWLRRVQTRPADFLKAKFAYQQSVLPEGGSR